MVKRDKKNGGQGHQGLTLSMYSVALIIQDIFKMKEYIFPFSLFF